MRTFLRSIGRGSPGICISFLDLKQKSTRMHYCPLFSAKLLTNICKKFMVVSRSFASRSFNKFIFDTCVLVLTIEKVCFVIYQKFKEIIFRKYLRSHVEASANSWKEYFKEMQTRKEQFYRMVRFKKNTLSKHIRSTSNLNRNSEIFSCRLTINLTNNNFNKYVKFTQLTLKLDLL